MTTESRNELIVKGQKLYEADVAANGLHINAPYRVMHEGEYYKVHVRPVIEKNEYVRDDNGNVKCRLDFVRPEATIGHVDL